MPTATRNTQSRMTMRALRSSALLAIAGLVLMLIWGSHRVIQVNRRRRWVAMTDQLRNDLRAWALRHPQLLSQLAEEAVGD